MDVAVTGSTGLIGSALCTALVARGDRVVRILRRAPSGRDEIHWDPAGGVLDPSDLRGTDAVVHLAGAGIADRRWTPAQRDRIRESRTRGTTLLAGALAEIRDDGGPSTLVSGSAIGFYGDAGDRILDESGPRGTGFLADVCVAWEQATERAGSAGVRVAHARTGVVLTPVGGLLAKQLPLFRLGLGGRLGSGRQYLSWISLQDEVAALLWLVDREVEGPVNLVAPSPVTNAGFARSLGSALGRPARLPVPAALPMVLFGRDLVRELMLASTRVRPRVLEDGGFDFSGPELGPALGAMVAGR
ncbi:MAG: TIGR01777 family oxidoreductase [Acidimicrobiales bacterium]|nr:TIGR01777 family oxidoreductase [Acidimicrobiales bacterium]